MEILNTWQFNLLVYIVFIVIFSQGYKLAVKETKNDGAATVLLQLIAGGSILLAAPLFELKVPAEPKLWILLLIASLFYALNDRLQTTARKHLPVSTYSIVSPFGTIFLILIGIFVFREPVVINKLIGAALILLANVLLVYKKGEIKINTYIWIALAAAMGFAIALSLDIGISQQFNLPIYIMLTLIIPAIIVSVAENIKFKDLAVEYNGNQKKYYIITGIAWGLAILGALRSFSFGEVTTIVPLQATTVLLNVLVAYIFLKEKDDRAKKVVAALMVMLGVYFTVI